MHHEKHQPTPLDRAVQAYREANDRIGALKEREATLSRELSGINREIEIVRVDLNKKAEMLLAEALK